MIARNTHNPSTMFDELIVDNFAGGGGASIGIEAGIGRAVDVAVNHSAEAVAMHRANHPHTLHLCQDVWTVDPIEATAGRPVGLAWFSPDCTHFSKARGGKPIRTTKSRDLAWVVIRWAKLVRPRVIMLENVEEFQTWGPLGEDGRPCPRRKGKTFRSWTKQLRDLGYAVQWRELRACDYGTPTIRKRLFLIARCDGQPIVWPEATYGPHDHLHHAVRDMPAPNERSGRRNGRLGAQAPIAMHGGNVPKTLRPYRTAAECIDWTLPCPSIFDRKRPLADNTLKRIAAGIKRYVIDAAEPFIVSIANYGGNGSNTRPIGEPLSTVTAWPKGGHHAIVVPTIVGAGGSTYAGKPVDVDRPIGTIKCDDRRALVSAFIVKHFGGMVGVPATTPLPTITARGTQNQLATVHLMHNTTGHAKGSLREPMHTLTSGNHANLVAALLVKYYGNDQHGQAVNEPLHTLPTKERFGLVAVYLHGEPYIITDIGMRMLQPHELYRAQGFPSDYIIDHGVRENGDRIELTKTAQVRLCGNSVCPPVSEALVRANLVEHPVSVEEVIV